MLVLIHNKTVYEAHFCSCFSCGRVGYLVPSKQHIFCINRACERYDKPDAVLLVHGSYEVLTGSKPRKAKEVTNAK